MEITLLALLGVLAFSMVQKNASAKPALVPVKAQHNHRRDYR